MLGWFLLPEMPLKTINLLFSSESALLPVWGEHVVSTGGKGRRDPTPTCSWVSPGPFFHHFMALFWWLLPVWWPAVSHQGGFSHEDRDPALCPRLLFPIFCLPVLKPVGFFFFPSPPNSLERAPCWKYPQDIQSLKPPAWSWGGVRAAGSPDGAGH